MSGVIPEELVQSEGGKFIKADEFVAGLKLRIAGFEIITANNSKYGATAEDALFKQEKLKEGETFRYSFTTVEENPEDFPEERVVESKSLALFIPFSQLNPEVGDVVLIKKTGSGDSTRYTVTPENNG